jgi:uncharacterized protein (DUF488 family)
VGGPPKKIYSAGTSTRTEAEFLGLLRVYDIRTLVDVRRFPTSKFEHFKRENLERFLKRAGINYVYLGKELGGYRKGGYEAHLHTEEFSQGLKELEKIGLEKPTLFVCAERLPWRCHRRFIGNALRERGWEVLHIIEADRVWQPK